MQDWSGNKKAVFVLPEKEKHVNIHNYCLHLFYSFYKGRRKKTAAFFYNFFCYMY